MNIQDVFAQARVVPVMTVDDVDAGLATARALVSGGLNVLEITLRTSVALAAIERIARELPEAVVGVGTVTKVDELRRAREAGARFAVSPGLDPELCQAAQAGGIPYMPAVQTGSEIMAARRLGFTALKFFPAKAAGGQQALQSFAPVFPDVVFCPTGGITAADYLDYLKLRNVIAVGGTFMTSADLVKRRDWRAIETLAREIVAGIR